MREMNFLCFVLNGCSGIRSKMTLAFWVPLERAASTEGEEQAVGGCWDSH